MDYLKRKNEDKMVALLTELVQRTIAKNARSNVVSRP